jgi:hypothetical protein
MALPDSPTVSTRRTITPLVVIAIVAVLVLIVLAASGALAQGITTVFWEAMKAVVLTLWNLLRKF